MTADRDKKRLVCTPDAYERISALLTANGWSDQYIVTTSAVVPPGQAIILQSDADFDAYMQRVGEQLHEELMANLQRRVAEDVQRIEADLRRTAEIRRQHIYAAVARDRISFGLVTGL